MDLITGAAVAAVLLGWLGTLLPLLPGTGLILAAAAVYGFVTGFVRVEPGLLGLLALLGLAAELAGYGAQAAGARRFGASRAGALGAVLGGALGLILLGPVGLLAGPLLGAFTAELAHRPDPAVALRAGIGAVAGSLGGGALRFLLAGAMVFLFLRAVL